MKGEAALFLNYSASQVNSEVMLVVILLTKLDFSFYEHAACSAYGVALKGP